MTLYIFRILKPVSIFSHYSVGAEWCAHLLSHFMLAGSVLLILDLSSFFTFWFSTSLLVSTEWTTEDQGLSIVSWNTTGFDCVGGSDPVLWVGCGPGSSHRMSGMFDNKCWNISTKGRHNITKVGDPMAKWERWSVVKGFDSVEVTSVGQQTTAARFQTLTIFRISGHVPQGPECETHTLENQGLRGRTPCG